MRRFMLGIILGVFLTGVLFFIVSSNTGLHLWAGRVLDKDKIYLTDGTVIHGWIEEEGRNYLWIGTEKGYYDLDRSKCERIEENYLLRYMRKLI